MSNRGALFGSAATGPGSTGGNKHLVEMRAGKMNLKGHTVYPDKRKGLLYVYQSEDSLMHFCWQDRTTGVVEDDLIIFPDDCEYVKVTQCTTGRVYLLKFKSSNRRFFFWLQEPRTDKDEDNCKRINEYLNNPAGSVPSSNAADQDLQSLLNNMSQSQLMQLLGGGQMGGLSSLLGTIRNEDQSQTSETVQDIQLNTEAGTTSSVSEMNLGISSNESLEQTNQIILQSGELINNIIAEMDTSSNNEVKSNQYNTNFDQKILIDNVLESEDAIQNKDINNSESQNKLDFMKKPNVADEEKDIPSEFNFIDDISDFKINNKTDSSSNETKSLQIEDNKTVLIDKGVANVLKTASLNTVSNEIEVIQENCDLTAKLEVGGPNIVKEIDKPPLINKEIFIDHKGCGDQNTDDKTIEEDTKVQTHQIENMDRGDQNSIAKMCTGLYGFDETFEKEVDLTNEEAVNQIINIARSSNLKLEEKMDTNDEVTCDSSVDVKKVTTTAISMDISTEISTLEDANSKTVVDEIIIPKSSPKEFDALMKSVEELPAEIMQSSELSKQINVEVDMDISTELPEIENSNTALKVIIPEFKPIPKEFQSTIKNTDSLENISVDLNPESPSIIAKSEEKKSVTNVVFLKIHEERDINLLDVNPEEAHSSTTIAEHQDIKCINVDPEEASIGKSQDLKSVNPEKSQIIETNKNQSIPITSIVEIPKTLIPKEVQSTIADRKEAVQASTTMNAETEEFKFIQNTLEEVQSSKITDSKGMESLKTNYDVKPDLSSNAQSTMLIEENELNDVNQEFPSSSLEEEKLKTMSSNIADTQEIKSIVGLVELKSPTIIETSQEINAVTECQQIKSVDISVEEVQSLMICEDKQVDNAEADSSNVISGSKEIKFDTEDVQSSTIIEESSVTKPQFKSIDMNLEEPQSSMIIEESLETKPQFKSVDMNLEDAQSLTILEEGPETKLQSKSVDINLEESSIIIETSQLNASKDSIPKVVQSSVIDSRDNYSVTESQIDKQTSAIAENTNDKIESIGCSFMEVESTVSSDAKTQSSDTVMDKQITSVAEETNVQNKCDNSFLEVVQCSLNVAAKINRKGNFGKSVKQNDDAILNMSIGTDANQKNTLATNDENLKKHSKIDDLASVDQNADTEVKTTQEQEIEFVVEKDDFDDKMGKELLENDSKNVQNDDKTAIDDKKIIDQKNNSIETVVGTNVESNDKTTKNKEIILKTDSEINDSKTDVSVVAMNVDDGKVDKDSEIDCHVPMKMNITDDKTTKNEEIILKTVSKIKDSKTDESVVAMNVDDGKVDKDSEIDCHVPMEKNITDDKINSEIEKIDISHDLGDATDAKKMIKSKQEISLDSVVTIKMNEKVDLFGAFLEKNSKTDDKIDPEIKSFDTLKSDDEGKTNLKSVENIFEQQKETVSITKSNQDIDSVDAFLEEVESELRNQSAEEKVSDETMAFQDKDYSVESPKTVLKRISLVNLETLKTPMESPNSESSMDKKDIKIDDILNLQKNKSSRKQNDVEIVDKPIEIIEIDDVSQSPVHIKEIDYVPLYEETLEDDDDVIEVKQTDNNVIELSDSDDSLSNLIDNIDGQMDSFEQLKGKLQNHDDFIPFSSDPPPPSPKKVNESYKNFDSEKFSDINSDESNFRFDIPYSSSDDDKKKIAGYESSEDSDSSDCMIVEPVKTNEALTNFGVFLNTVIDKSEESGFKQKIMYPSKKSWEQRHGGQRSRYIEPDNLTDVVEYKGKKKHEINNANQPSTSQLVETHKTNFNSNTTSRKELVQNNVIKKRKNQNKKRNMKKNMRQEVSSSSDFRYKAPNFDRRNPEPERSRKRVYPFDMTNVSVWIPDEPIVWFQRLHPSDVLHHLQQCNYTLKTELWTIVWVDDKSRGQEIIYSIDPESLEVLKRLDFHPNYRNSTVQMKICS